MQHLTNINGHICRPTDIGGQDYICMFKNMFCHVRDIVLIHSVILPILNQAYCGLQECT
jgi:hypothetical protein